MAAETVPRPDPAICAGSQAGAGRCESDSDAPNLPSGPLTRPASVMLSSMKEDPAPSGELSVREAFLAMSDFIWEYARSAGDDLITLLGDTRLQADGDPTDPAAWTDWLRSVERIKAGLPPRSET